jgi:hypothetical protein
MQYFYRAHSTPEAVLGVVSLFYWRVFRFTRQLQTPPIENG